MRHPNAGHGAYRVFRSVRGAGERSLRLGGPGDAGCE